MNADRAAERVEFEMVRAGAEVFEVDHPASQRDKRGRIGDLPPLVKSLRYVPVDFTRDRLDPASRSANSGPCEPAASPSPTGNRRPTAVRSPPGSPRPGRPGEN